MHSGTARPSGENRAEGNAVFPVAVIAAAGWLFLFIVLLALLAPRPPDTRTR
jgi:hypothetical protein